MSCFLKNRKDLGRAKQRRNHVKPSLPYSRAQLSYEQEENDCKIQNSIAIRFIYKKGHSFLSKYVVAEAKHEEKKIGGKRSLLWFYRANILDEEGSHANRYKTILVLFVERYTFPSAEVKQEKYLSCEE